MSEKPRKQNAVRLYTVEKTTPLCGDSLQ